MFYALSSLYYSDFLFHKKFRYLFSYLSFFVAEFAGGAFEFVFCVFDGDFFDGCLAVFKASTFVCFMVAFGAAASADVDVGVCIGARCDINWSEKQLPEKQGCGKKKCVFHRRVVLCVR